MPANTSVPPGNEFSLLLETEARLDALLANARQQAQRLEEQAAAEVALREAEAREKIRLAEQAVQDEIQHRFAALADESRSRTSATVKRLRDLPETRLGALAGYVLARLSGDPPS